MFHFDRYLVWFCVRWFSGWSFTRATTSNKNGSLVHMQYVITLLIVFVVVLWICFQCISLASNLFEKLREHCSVPERKRKRSLTIRRTFYTNWFVIASYSCGSKRKRLTMLQSVKKPVGLFFLLELSFTAKCWNKLKNKPHNLYRNYMFVPEYLMLLLLVCLLIIFSVMSN